MSITILLIGMLVFFAHFLSFQFAKTHIPDVLVLTLVGILVGPLFGIVSPADFGRVGPLIATIALVVILFEGGTSLKLDVMGKSLGTTGLLSIACFILTTAIITSIGMLALGLATLPAMMLGLTLGCTSSAVVIPMVKSLKMSEKPSTVLVLESALTDVLSIVGVFALLQIHSHGDVEPGRLIGSVMAALVFAAMIGVMGGIGWLMVLSKMRGFPNTISSTLAYVFIVYGLTELLEFSGAIAALALGITLTNYQKLGLGRLSFLNRDQKLVPLNETDLSFYHEAVFLLKTYFFVYLGISFSFGLGEIYPAIAAISMVFMVYGMRLALTRYVFRDVNYSLRDTALTSLMAPKGLASAVLATLPLKYGVVGGELIQEVAYMVVVFSITLTALLVIAYPSDFAQRVYAHTLRKPLDAKPAKQVVS